MKISFFLALFVLSLSHSTLVADAAPSTAPGAGSLPPGMTPAMMKMIMTPAGPAHPKGMPPGFRPFVGCIPTMGYHYYNPKIGLTGPLYGWYNGKLVFTEWMPSPRQLKTTLYDDILRPLPGYRIDHVDIWPTTGHPG
ncbi:hypothetical protein [Vulcanimicrobium alpinum]|nr:hypothetical protein [Vulcanimicrobium alpinum]